MGGNVVEWTEGVAGVNNRVIRGGGFSTALNNLTSSNRGSAGAGPTTNFGYLGIRLALVPEPATMLTMALAGFGLIRRR